MHAPFAPAHLLGLGSSAPASAPYPDQGFDIPYSTTLTSGQALRDFIEIERDADFIWRAIVLNSQTGIYKVQFDINGWYLLSANQILNANLASDPSSPYVLHPPFPVPAGGRVGIFITDLSLATNDIQIVLRGVKRFK